MRFQATGGFCGCTSLAVGVQVVCFFGLLRYVITLSTVSSTKTGHFMGLAWSPYFQCLCGMWAVLGVFLAIRAGVAGLYKLEQPLREYFTFLLLTSLMDIYWASYVLFNGSICETLVPEDTRRMGSHIVCSMTECFVVFWAVVFYITALYFIYIVWSAAEEAKRGMQAAPELLEYIDKLYEELNQAKAISGGPAQPQYGATGQQEPPAEPMMKQSVAEYGSWHTGEAPDEPVQVLSGFLSKPLMRKDDPDAPGARDLARREMEAVLERQPILFQAPPNRNMDRLRDVGRASVAKVAEVMEKHPNIGFKIEVTAGGGLTDSKEMRGRESRLAEARAEEVKNELQKTHGVKNYLRWEGLGYGGGFHGRVFINPL